MARELNAMWDDGLQPGWPIHPYQPLPGPSSSCLTHLHKRELVEEIEKILLAKEETRNVFAAKDRQIFLVKVLLGAMELFAGHSWSTPT
ncbi:MAG: hypothetical protein Q9210_004426 [Variospora velana]